MAQSHQSCSFPLSERPRRARWRAARGRLTPPRLGLAIGLLALGLPARPAAAASGALEIFPNLPLLGLMIVLFALLIIPVNAVLVQPLLRVLDERRERIDGARARAGEVAKQADDVIERYETALRAANEESEQSRKSLLTDARQEHAAATAQARSETEQEVAAARQEIASALGDARGQLRQQAEALAREAAAQVLGRPLS